MAIATLKRLVTGIGPIIGLVSILLVSLKLMSDATANSTAFSQIYSLLLVVNLIGLLALVILISINIYRLLRQLRRRIVGARITARLLVMIVVLSVTPVLVVYYFSLQFLHQGIDSWFDVRIEKALDDALELSRTSLDSQMRELLRKTEQLSREIGSVPNQQLALNLGNLRQRSGAQELTVISQKGGIVASSSADSTTIVPNRPDDAVLLQVRQTGSYIGLDPIPDIGLQVRVVIEIPGPAPPSKVRIIQALFPIAGRMNELAEGVQSAFAHYRELAYLRTPLKKSFTLTLSLVLLLSLMSAVWAAFFSARRLTAPIRDLAEGTRAVAEGNYETQLPPSGEDEMGFLVGPFNEMTRKLALTRDEAHRSQREVEEQRAYLEAVLARLSSGVITLDHEQRLYTVNNAATNIMDVDLNLQIGNLPHQISDQHPHLRAFTEIVARHIDAGSRDWREEVTLFGPEGRQVLMCRGASLTTSGEYVIVFDDVTTLIQAQRDAAWSEVAKRLAHEIKNPLTPIRLSAERLRHKYLPKMHKRDHEVLDRLTHTIVQQVEAMKEMVDAFSNYARTPQIRPELLDINKLVNEVLELYRHHNGDTRIVSRLEPDLPALEADPGRLRQVLHNVIKNALEAPASGPRVVTVASHCGEEHSCHYLEIGVEDDGSGFPAKILDHAFEPYVTTKTKGSGLGLAIVKKIVEEHGGMVKVENRPEGGARIQMRFPAVAASTMDTLPKLKEAP